MSSSALTMDAAALYSGGGVHSRLRGGDGWRRSRMTKAPPPPPWRHLREGGASSGSSFTVARNLGDDVLYGEYLDEDPREEEEERDEEEVWRRAAHWPSLPHDGASCNCRGGICSGGPFPSAI
ncbi:hypothetical protein QYE76_052894 [Lolium multiflorum]|uniref:Uncharacterized protein n=1 Tax=Lolium multiflorum TaxID=4521 RepID=A0AAD8WM06_LOLMU|nr:hypothetical protein QYE76_052894 [Lolium multiflorum]